jgi:CCR4-NOT transcription complex subunit 7/8
MPPQVSRMHPSHMSNPFVHLNSQNSIPQSSYQSHTSHLPGSFTSQPSFGGTTISPFPTSATYGASAFTPGASSSVFNGGTIGAQGQGQGLASVAAQQGFARGAAMQEHTAHQLEAASMDSKSGANSRIRQVWRHNLEQEMAVLRQLIIKYPYVSMVCCHFISGETRHQQHFY